MKGLLLKDWYMTKKYCKGYLLIALAFMAGSLAVENSMFFVFYPCSICSMIPIILLSYDERSHFISYSGTLPCTREQIVSSKYVIGLITQAAMLILTGIAQGVRMGIKGNFKLGEFLVLMFMLLVVSTLASSIPLPFVFKLGTEKGRVAYYVMIGFVCGSAVIGASSLRGDMGADIRPSGILIILTVLSVCVYALSWYLSVRFFEKREL